MKRNIFLFLFLIILIGCNKSEKIDLSGIEADIEIERFDKLLFEMDPDTLDRGISYLYSGYDDFLDIFSYYIINIGNPGDREYATYLSMFLNDRLNREVYESTLEVFPDLEKLNSTFREAFRRYKYYFPEDTIPRVVSFISRFNNPSFTVGNYMGIGLDMYLGPDSEYYERIGIPLYRRVNMTQEKIPSDALAIWLNSKFLYSDSIDNVLAHIIHEGKIIYFLSKLLPGEPDSLLIGFTDDQLTWCKNNEEQMWLDLVERKLIFSQDAMDIRKLTGVAPFTSFFTSESPGRAAVWTGWQIVQEYADRNRNLSMKQIMENNDYQEILRLSKYNP